MKKLIPILVILPIVMTLEYSCTTKVKNNASEKRGQSINDDYTVASYYFPNYHVDPRNVRLYGNDWTEWELVKNARPRFEGHLQPKVPAWGYTDEANPKDMEQKIDAAADHGIDVFIFDWYYYNDGPFLEKAIEQGLFNAKNNNRIRFGLMWANHDWVELFPIDAETRLSKEGPQIHYPGTITAKTWESMTDYIIEKYFKHPSYWLIDFSPYFSVYDMTRFIENFGSVKATLEGIEYFRQKVKKEGFKDLHMNAVVWGRTILPSEEMVEREDMDALLKQMGFTSTTSYVWIHHVEPDFPTHSYNDMKHKYFSYAGKYSSETELPYFPNITMGWDSSPRAAQKDEFKKLGYPFIGVLVDNTPENFKQALKDMKTFLDTHPDAQNTFLINCWNEWTEGSYLEPDVVHGMAYLEAVKEVFGNK